MKYGGLLLLQHPKSDVIEEKVMSNHHKGKAKRSTSLCPLMSTTFHLTYLLNCPKEIFFTM